VDCSKVTAMVIDNGLFVEIALRLAREYGKVYYCYPNISSFPKLNKAMIGSGFDEIEVIDSPDRVDHDDIDLFVFTDVGFGPMQVRLESEGRNVWGPRMGEDLELEREWAKKLFNKIGMPGNVLGEDYEIIKGFSNLRDYLKENDEKWVKVSRYRGSFETFFSPSYDYIEPRLDEIEYRLGKFKDKLTFVVENNLPDHREVGIDGYNIDGQLPSKLLCGLEVKDESYIACFKSLGDIPEPIIRFDKKIAPTLKKLNYRGFWSTEIRIAEDMEPHILDPCVRAGSPPSELYQEFFSNLPEIIWEGSQGNLIDPEPIDGAKYGVEVKLVSNWAKKSFQDIRFPEEYRQNVKLTCVMKDDDKYFVIPQDEENSLCGSVVGWGDTLHEAIDMVVQICKEIKGHDLEARVASLEKAEEEIEKTKEIGLDFFDE
jgi:hypothetical protein